MRRNVEAQRVFATNIRNVLEAETQGPETTKGTNGDAPEGIPPRSTSVSRRL